MDSKFIPATAKIYLERWLADHEPFGPWADDKFYKFIGALILTKRKAVRKDTLKQILEKVIKRGDKTQVIDEALKRFEIIYDFIMANSNLIVCKFNRSYHNYTQKT